MLITGCANYDDWEPGVTQFKGFGDNLDLRSTTKMEVVGVGKDDIHGILYSIMSFKGYDLEDESNSQIRFYKRNSDFWTNALLSSRYDGKVYDRVTINTFKIRDTIKIQVGVAVITNRGSAFEQVTEMTAQSQEVHDFTKGILTEIKENVEEHFPESEVVWN